MKACLLCCASTKLGIAYILRLRSKVKPPTSNRANVAGSGTPMAVTSATDVNSAPIPEKCCKEAWLWN